MRKAVILWLTVLLAASLPAWSKKQEPALTLTRGARIGVVTLLAPEVVHYHTSNTIQNSFMRTYPVQWAVDAMFLEAVKQRLAQMGLEAVPVPPTQALERGRTEFFIDNSVSNGLSRACADEFTQMATADHVDAFIVLVPGVNDYEHAGSARRKDLPETLHGWGFMTKGEQPGAKPTVFNMTQVLLVSGTGGVALLRARAFGGPFVDSWVAFSSAPDLKDAPPEIDTLKPVLTGVVSQQSDRVFDQIYVVGGP
jgi:hypothetical protein